MDKDSQRQRYYDANPKRLAKTAPRPLNEEFVLGIYLNILKYPEFVQKCPCKLHCEAHDENNKGEF